MIAGGVRRLVADAEDLEAARTEALRVVLQLLEGLRAEK
jgi:hypothetical protein